MTRRIPSATSVLKPLFAWQMLGLRMAETIVASTHVIAHRARRRNNPAQLFEMGNEKVQAAMESSHAMARHLMDLPTHDALALWNAWLRMASSGLAPYHSRVMKNARRARATTL